MLIEALKPLRVRLRSGEVRHLRPGQRSEFTREDGQKILERAVGKVRLVEDSITVGMVVTWDSPLFGVLRAIVLEALDMLVDCRTQTLHPRDPDRIIAEIE